MCFFRRTELRSGSSSSDVEVGQLVGTVGPPERQDSQGLASSFPARLVHPS